jgi:hypothetical protein
VVALAACFQSKKELSNDHVYSMDQQDIYAQQ